MEPTLTPPAIGFLKDFTNADGSIQYDKLAGMFIDGPTGLVFANLEDWMSHVSPISGTPPTDPQYLIKTTTPNYAAIAAAAQKRASDKAAATANV